MLLANMLSSASIGADVGGVSTSVFPATSLLWRQTRVAANSHYKAFPASLMIGSSIVFLYSDGTGHGDSDRQYMVRTDDNGITYREVVFVEDIAPTVFNYELISDLMVDGDILHLKSWTIVKADGVCWTYTNSTVADYTNYQKYSQDHDNAAWVKVGVATLTPDTATYSDMLGTDTLDYVVFNAGTGAYSIDQTMTGLSPNQTLCTMKALRYHPGGPRWIRMFMFDANSGANYVACFFDILNGVVGTASNVGNGSGATGTIIQAAGGNFICVLTGKPNTSGTNTQALWRPANSNGSTTYTSDGVNGTYMGRGQTTIGSTTRTPILKTAGTALATGVGANTVAYWNWTKKEGSTWYRGGYSTVPADNQSALFTSDDGYAWTRLCTFDVVGEDLNEFDIVKLDNGNFVGVWRGDASGGRQLYFGISVGGDNSWGALQPIDQTLVAGTQPNLLKLLNGRLLLAVGDRTGASGMSADGIPNLTDENRTGVSISLAPADISTADQWGPYIQIGLSYSSDCGQPELQIIGNGTVWLVFYTLENSAAEPGIFAGLLSVA